MTNYLLISGLMSLTVFAMNYVMHLFKITNYRLMMGGDGSPNYCVNVDLPTTVETTVSCPILGIYSICIVRVIYAALFAQFTIP